MAIDYERTANRSGSRQDGHVQANVSRVEIIQSPIHVPVQVYPQNQQQSQPQLHPNGSIRSQYDNGEPISHSSGSLQYDHFISEHEIKFTRTDICTPSSCICFFIAILFSFMAIMSGIYYGLNFFDGKHLQERVFKVQFVMFDHDISNENLENVESIAYKSLSESIRQPIDLLFRESSLSKSYTKCEIVAFERKPNKPSQLVVHFNIHVTDDRKNIESGEVFLVLADEISNNRLKLFERWTIDHSSLDVQERKWAPRERSALLVNPWTYKSMFPGMLEGLSTEPTPIRRKCQNIGLNYCKFLSYNQTSYPNVLNHWNLSAVEDDFIVYKEIIDSECYALAKEFICLLLQPECGDNEIYWPCQSFCFEFYNSCHRWLSPKVSQQIVCGSFPNDEQRTTNELACRSKPNCTSRLKLHHPELVCDGIHDCPNGMDEQNCGLNVTDQCNEHGTNCNDRYCQSTNSSCLWLCRNCVQTTSMTDTKHAQREMFLDEGFLMSTYKGKDSFVCSESSLVHMRNYSHNYYNNQLQILGLNICNERHFEELLQIESKRIDIAGPFTKFVPGTTLISSHSSNCKNREIYYVQCAIAKCGIGDTNQLDLASTSSSSSSSSSLSSRGWQRALPGHWPWFAKVNLNGNHFCEGSLVSPDSVLMYTTCMNNDRGPMAIGNYTVTIGSVRMYQDNVQAQTVPAWQLTTMPFNGNAKLNIVRLASPINATRFVRHVCNDADQLSSINNLTNLPCTLLNLNYVSNQLQYRPVRIVELEKCGVGSNGNGTNVTKQSQMVTYEKMRQTPTKLCVEWGEKKSLNGCMNGTIDGECPMGGRHLFCHFKFSWHLIAIEMASMNATRVDDKSNLYLQFDTLFRINV